jgi:hypothetical protein
MITHFIKMAKRLNELHSFNCLMAIIVALKSAPIFRLKKTWSQHVSKRDTTQFERLADLMFDTSDNKRKIRDMHMNVKLPCIPFLGLFLTDLIHIDIAHPHNSFDNPQRRNQMNNICRLISEFQQSNYQDLTSISCSCTFSTTSTSSNLDQDHNHHHHHHSNNINSGNGSPTIESVCVLNNCSCGIHHGDGYGAGIINSDGTIYISEISYVHNYLNSFLYIEELQKFKEDENYRDSLELEPEPSSSVVNTPSSSQSNGGTDHVDSKNNDTPPHNNTSSPNKLFFNDSQNLKINVNQNSVSSNSGGHRFKLNNGNGALTSYNSVASAAAENNTSLVLNYYHRKSLSLNNNNLLNETKEFLNELKLRHHPLDDSIVESTTDLPVLTTTTVTEPTTTLLTSTATAAPPQPPQVQQISLNLNFTKEQQKQILNSVKLTDPPSLLKELLKHRHSNILLDHVVGQQNTTTTSNKSHRKSSGVSHHKNKFNCYSGNATSSDCECEGDDLKIEENKNDLNNVSTKSNKIQTAIATSSPKLKRLNVKINNSNNNNSNESSDGENTTIVLNSNNGTKENSSSSNRRISGRNLIQVLNESAKMPASLNNVNATNSVSTTANSLTTSTISYGNNLESKFSYKNQHSTVYVHSLSFSVSIFFR